MDAGWLVGWLEVAAGLDFLDESAMAKMKEEEELIVKAGIYLFIHRVHIMHVCWFIDFRWHVYLVCI